MATAGPRNISSASGPLPDSTQLRRPPAELSPVVRAFCRDTAAAAAQFLVCRPAPHARRSCCFENVRSHVERHGGAIVFGWVVWEWPGTLLEAEHHAVWRSPDGQLTDITPHAGVWPQVLFLPQPDLAFDFEGRHRIDNRRRALRPDANVRTYIDHLARVVAIEEANSRGMVVELKGEPAREMMRLRAEIAGIERELVAWSLARLGRNAPCWCGSGEKYKRCCGLPGPAQDERRT